MWAYVYGSSWCYFETFTSRIVWRRRLLPPPEKNKKSSLSHVRSTAVDPCGMHHCAAYHVKCNGQACGDGLPLHALTYEHLCVCEGHDLF